MASVDTLVFHKIKADFVGDAEVGYSKMQVEIKPFVKPKKNKEGGDSAYLLKAETKFYYDGVQYKKLIINDITITGIMKKHGAVPITGKDTHPEYFNFVRIRDEKMEDAYMAALSDPVNREEVMMKNPKYKPGDVNSGNEYKIKTTLEGKKYAPNCMVSINDQPLENPAILFKLRNNKEPKYIYSCVFDVVGSDGKIEPLKPDRKMPVNNIPIIKKTLGNLCKLYYGDKDIQKMLDDGEYVHDLPMPEDVVELITAYSVIKIGKIDLSGTINICKTNNWVNCDMLPTYLMIKPNNNRDLDVLVNEMRSLDINALEQKKEVSENNVNETKEIVNEPVISENNNNL